MKKFSEMQYIRPDYAVCEEQLNAAIRQLEQAQDYAQFRSAVFALETLNDERAEMVTLAEIRSTMDKTDSFYETEQEAISEGEAKIALVMQRARRVMTGSSFRAQFDAEFGGQYMKEAEIGLRLVSEEIVPDMIEEDRLGREYSKAAALCSCEFRGEECNFYGLLKHMESTDREERAEAFRAWAGLYEKVSPELDAIYDRLVALRVQKAKKLGFANYIDYIYLANGHYDYRAPEVAEFRRQVREVLVPICSELFAAQAKRLGVDQLHWYDEALVFPEGNAVPIGTMEELVEKARRMYEEMSPETGEFFNFMTRYELFDLETRPGKHLGGYCTFLPVGKAPFIFSNFNGTSADVDVLTHEAGHAFEAFTASRALPFSGQVFSSSEICEIHSMSMEHLAYPWMDSFFGPQADRYRYAHLCSAVMTIPYLVCVDEFQHRVFEKPEMTAAERRGVWHEIEQTYMPWRDYDGNAFLAGGGFWMQKQHIFLYPFYYIDYALAQTCAFQFLLKAEKDRTAAWEQYLQLCRSGGSRGCFETLSSGGLLNPFAEGTLAEIMEGVKAVIHSFADKI